MSEPSEGLNANMYLGTICPAGTENVIALFQGVDISWSQEKVRWYHQGSLSNYYILDGIIAWQGAFRSAYTTNKFPGTLNIGTTVFCGSITPRGTIGTPCIVGSVVLSAGVLSNMAAGNANAVTEENSFIMYNLTITG